MLFSLLRQKQIFYRLHSQEKSAYLPALQMSINAIFITKTRLTLATNERLKIDNYAVRNRSVVRKPFFQIQKCKTVCKLKMNNLQTHICMFFFYVVDLLDLHEYLRIGQTV